MKLSWVFAAGLLLIGPPALAATAPTALKHVSKVKVRGHDGPGALTVVTGSEIKITPYGEVIVPPTSVISVEDGSTAPAGRPDMHRRPEAGAPSLGAPADVMPPAATPGKL